MQAFIKLKHVQIEELCATYHVRKLSVFGSAVRSDFDPERSDVDLIVEFESLSELQYAPNYFAFLDALELLFSRRVDLVSIISVRNPHLLSEIRAEQELLYAA